MSTIKSLAEKCLIIISLIGLAGCLRSPIVLAEPPITYRKYDQISAIPLPSTNSEKTFATREPVIKYRTLPGDGGGCMADYLGWTAPAFVLYADGYLLKQNPREDPWYGEAHQEKDDVAALLQEIANTGFFSVSGDGSEYEHDPIYRFPADYDRSMGAGSVYFLAHQGERAMDVTVYTLWLDYVIPEVSNAFQAIMDYQAGYMAEYLPGSWVGWAENLDPCESYQLEYLPWPENAPDISVLMSGASRGQLVFQNKPDKSFNQTLGNKPGTFIWSENGVNYYILTRPLLPHELPSDFQVY